MISSGQKFGKYTLLERIAEGGMAEIYKASVIGNDGREHIVALKRLHRAFCEDHELTQMLVDEARIAVQLQHPHVAQVFDLGTLDQQHFLVMEFVAGQDLHQLLKFARQKRVYLPTPAVVLTLIHVADALQYAHTRRDAEGRPLQIVHRDVSPQNIMVSSRGEVKLVDFGIAKAKNRAQVTQHGIIKGKYYYMAPEQAHGHHVDARTDIYSLGMVLYEGLCGRSPFEDVPEHELLKAVRQSSFRPPSYYRPDLDPELDAIVEKMTQRDPNLRFQSMSEVRSVLADYGTRKLGAFGPGDLARTAADLAEVRPTVEYDLLSPNTFAPSENSMIFNVESGILELHSSEFELLEAEAEELFDPNPFGGNETIVYQEEHPGTAGPLVEEAVARKSMGMAASQPAQPTFNPGLAFEPRQPAPGEQSREAGYAATAAAPDFNAGKPRSAGAGKKSSSRSSQIIYGLVGLAVLLVAILGVMMILGEDNGVEDPEKPEIEVAVDTTDEPTLPKDPKIKFALGSTPANAQIFIDGEAKGSTPKIVEFDEGSTHTVELKRPGYATVTREIEVSADQTELNVQLELASGILKIQSYPPGAMVEIDGKQAGKTNLTRSGFPLDQKLKVIAHLDGEKLIEEIVWDPNEPIREVMFEFETPPVADETVAIQEEEPRPAPAPRPRRRRTTRPRTVEKKETKASFNVWGDSAKENKKNTSDEDETEDLDIWGGSKKKKKKKEEKEEPAGGLDVWGG